MNYTILGITALVIAIVVVVIIFREVGRSDNAHRKQACDIGEEAWRLLMKKQHGNKYF